MPESFFEPGKRSHCLFSPDLWCDVFNPSAPFATFDFLCDIRPQTVAVILPSPAGESGEKWDRIYRTIEAVWQSRQIGFHCERVEAEAWTQAQPCGACTQVRTAQVVVVDYHGGDPRAGSFREMALGSANSLEVLKNFGPAPSKQVILISAGAVDLPPHYQKVFHWIDYSGPDGTPDLAKLGAAMEVIAREDLFQSGGPLTFEASEFEPTAEETPAPAPAAREEQEQEQELAEELDIKFLGEIPVESEAPEDRSPEQRLDDALAEADQLARRGRYAAAFEALQAVSRRPEIAREARLRAAEREYLSRMNAQEVATVYFRGRTARDRARFALSDWRGGRFARAQLKLQDNDLRRLFHAGEVEVYAGDRLLPSDVADVRGELIGRPEGARSAVIVAGECEEATCRSLLELRADKAMAVELHLADLRRFILERTSAVDTLRDRLRADHRRARDLFLRDLNRPVCADRDFFGRDKLAELLAERLRSGDGFAVYGLPRSGKSSLLWRLARLPSLNDHLLVVVDLENQVSRQPAELYACLLRTVSKAVAAKYPSGGRRRPAPDLAAISELLSSSATNSAEELRSGFEESLQDLCKAIRGEIDPGFQRLVLLLDEVESILPGNASGPAAPGEHRAFFARLRSLMQDGTIAVGMTALGFALEQELSDLACPLRGYVQGFPIGGLSDEECDRMIRSLGHQMYRYFDDEAVERIVRESGGHPLLTRYLCSLILDSGQHGGAMIDLAAARRGAEQALETRNLRRRLERTFDELVRHFRTGADLLRELASEDGAAEGVDLNRLRQRTQLPANDLDRMLDTLVAYGLLAPAGAGRFRHRIGLLDRWLQQTAES